MCFPRSPGLHFLICRMGALLRGYGKLVGAALPRQRAFPGPAAERSPARQVLSAASEHQGRPRHEAPQTHFGASAASAGPLPPPPGLVTDPGKEARWTLTHTGRVPSQLGKPLSPLKPSRALSQSPPRPSTRPSSSPTAACWLLQSSGHWAWSGLPGPCAGGAQGPLEALFSQ